MAIHTKKFKDFLNVDKNGNPLIEEERQSEIFVVGYKVSSPENPEIKINLDEIIDNEEQTSNTDFDVYRITTQSSNDAISLQPPFELIVTNCSKLNQSGTYEDFNFNSLAGILKTKFAEISICNNSSDTHNCVANHAYGTINKSNGIAKFYTLVHSSNVTFTFFIKVYQKKENAIQPDTPQLYYQIDDDTPVTVTNNPPQDINPVDNSNTYYYINTKPIIQDGRLRLFIPDQYNINFNTIKTLSVGQSWTDVNLNNILTLEENYDTPNGYKEYKYVRKNGTNDDDYIIGAVNFAFQLQS